MNEFAHGVAVVGKELAPCFIVFVRGARFAPTSLEHIRKSFP